MRDQRETGTDEARAQSEEWRRILTEGHASMVWARRAFRLLPSAPRCKVCSNPFGGVGGRLVAIAGFRRSRKNPNLCTRCCDSLPPGGAEIDVAVLFADVRSSTELGRGVSPSDFAALMNRFYATATATLLKHEGVIDKMIGDEVMALFIRGISGPDYRHRAVRAGTDLLRAVGYGSPSGPWLEIGVAVNAGVAFVGNIGEAVVDFTALGDPVNVAARMQAQAGTGELLVASGVDDDDLGDAPRRTVPIRGQEQPIEVAVLGA